MVAVRLVQLSLLETRLCYVCCSKVDLPSLHCQRLCRYPLPSRMQILANGSFACFSRRGLMSTITEASRCSKLPSYLTCLAWTCYSSAGHRPHLSVEHSPQL